ncbi:hypothetical protein RJJ37_05135 [Rhizobium redzepovicii]|uniref:Uncharacterized protein n=1 Tax=Rhizobium redzepovicii TaxID=2867518 RepID=A0AAW8NWH9_9HYPH|nr:MULTISPECIES: hypothetical protein [Rhizobium]MDF0659422.1 hypothetical protein [Rhizobium sp. BC49]MDR9759022.1 hypothetical protein [Rhizobium redzepovicii]MDR9784763.1 hypothetical protein [Rhizobium redzepovicii]ULJ80839.1 hypothetical protein MF410_04295 [Rhizobium sp. C104]
MSVSPLAIAIWVVHASSIIFLAVVVGRALFDRWFGIGNPSPSRQDLAAFLGVLLFSTNIYLQGLDEIGGDLRLAGVTAALYGRSDASWLKTSSRRKQSRRCEITDTSGKILAVVPAYR